MRYTVSRRCGLLPPKEARTSCAWALPASASMGVGSAPICFRRGTVPGSRHSSVLSARPVDGMSDVAALPRSPPSRTPTVARNSARCSGTAVSGSDLQGYLETRGGCSQRLTRAERAEQAPTGWVAAYCRAGSPAAGLGKGHRLETGAVRPLDRRAPRGFRLAASTVIGPLAR